MAESLFHASSFAFPPLYPSSSASAPAPSAALGLEGGDLGYTGKYRTGGADMYATARGGGAYASGAEPPYEPQRGGQWLGGWGAESLDESPAQGGVAHGTCAFRRRIIYGP